MTASPSDQPRPTDPTSTDPAPEAVEAQAPAPAEPEPAVDEAPAEPEAATEPEAPAEPEAAEQGSPGPSTDAPSTDAPPADAAEAGEPKKDKKKKPKEKKKPSGPDPSEVVRRIGTTSAAALAYVQDPDPKLSRMARKHREAIITEVPPVTAGALLGAEALCRHFIASAATGRYQDLFFLWDLFKAFPEECKPVLQARQRAQERAKAKLRTATHLGLLGDADRVAADIDRATGLPWKWLTEILEPMGPAIRQRPAVMAALARKSSGVVVEVPDDPSDRWLAEAAALKDAGVEIPEAVDAALGAHADRLPATVATLQMATDQYPEQVSALIDRVDLDAPDIGAIMAWAHDHGHGQQLTSRVGERVRAAAAADRATGLSEWTRWQRLGVEVPMPESLTVPTLEGLDLGRPESADLIKRMVDDGADLDPQQILDDVAASNRMLGEKAYEAFVCAGFDAIHLPLVLEGNPMVRPETRCQACQAWTWVRPGHEQRCPRPGEPAARGDFAPDEDPGAASDAAVAARAGPAQDPPPTAASGAPDSRPATAPADRPSATPPPATDGEPAASAPEPAEPSAAPEVPQPESGSEPDAAGAAATASADAPDHEPGTTGS